MKQNSLLFLMALGAAVSARADFNPAPLTPGSFTADVVVEKTARPPLQTTINATLDGGTNRNGATWYETGLIGSTSGTGLPVHGRIITAYNATDHRFQMPVSYVGNNSFLVNNQLTDSILTLTTPAAYNTLSLVSSSGGGDCTVNYTIHYADNTSESGSFTSYDWFNTSSAPTNQVVFISNGRWNADDATFNAVNNTPQNPRIFFNDLALGNTTSAVTSIDFNYGGGGRACILALSGSTGGNFDPIAFSGQNADTVVESVLRLRTTVTMDGGTNNTGNTWYERGFNRDAGVTSTTGLPVHDSVFTAANAADHQFKMPADYTVNNVVMIGNYAGYTTGTLTLSTPTALSSISILNSCGNGPVSIDYTIHHADASTETGNFSSLDWFNSAAAAYVANGRVSQNNSGFGNVNGGTVKLFFNDLAVGNTNSPVTSIDFTYVSGGRAGIFAASGSTGGDFTPLAVTGFNADMVVEAPPISLRDFTTATMDGGNNNTANTWYEQGYYDLAPNSGLPPAGSIISSTNKPDHHYQFAASYTGNNAVYCDSNNPVATITFATPTNITAVSFLSATANQGVQVQVILHHVNGSTETNTFNAVDWFNNVPAAFTSSGRVNGNNAGLNNVNSSNPRLYEAEFPVLNGASPVDSAQLIWTTNNGSGGMSSASSRFVVMAVSVTSGAFTPIISSVTPASMGAYEGSNAVFTAVISGGTEPITYQWQKDDGAGNFADLTDDGNIVGSHTASLSFIGAITNNVGRYRLVASNTAGSVNGTPVNLTQVVSPIPDVTAPGDYIMHINGTVGGGGNEGAPHAIDNRTDKYLNFDDDAANPFVGPVGFIVRPSLGNTIVTALRIYTANDTAGRDPSQFILEGSLDGAEFTFITASGLSLPDARNAGGAAINPLTQNLQEVRFDNTVGYAYYRLTFPNVKDPANVNNMQLGEVELLGVLNTNAPPIFSVGPTNTTVNEGTTATFYSSAYGSGPITYQWYDVTAGDPGTLLTGETAPNLSLPAVTTAQSGKSYRVVASNTHGSTTNPAVSLPAAQLTVASGPPSILVDVPSQILTYAGRTIVVPVTVSGTSPFTYQWYSNGVAMVDGGRVSGVHSNVLTIAGSLTADSAAYHVTVSNAQGGPVQSGDANVMVQAVPTFNTDGTGWTLNGGASITSDVLTLTTGGSQARSAFYNVARLYIGSFRSTFTYQDVGGGGADGCAFVIQNDPRGVTALGGGGSGLGYSGITNSAALEFNIFGTAGFALHVNGATGGYTSSDPVNVASGDPIDVVLEYVGGVMRLSLSNTVSAATFTTNLVVGDLTSVLGTNQAFVGITGASGGVASSQQVSNFTYAPLPTIVSAHPGGTLVITWPAYIGGFVPMSSSSLGSGSWQPVNAPVVQVGDQFQVTITPLSGAGTYYRLGLP